MSVDELNDDDDDLYLNIVSFCCGIFWHVKAEDRPHQCAEYIGKAARVLIRLKRWVITDSIDDVSCTIIT